MDQQQEDKLHSGALGFLDAIVMGVAGSAPAYSIAATTPLLFAAVAFAGPAALLWCGIPMFGIAIAYHRLNRLGASAGAAYAWVGRVLHPYLGFMTGWCLVVSALIFMVAGSLPAGSAVVSLFSEHAANDTGWVVGIGTLWFLIMTYFVARGVRITANAQWIMSTVEVGLLIVFVILGFVHAANHQHVAFSWSWLWFSHFSGFAGGKAGFVGGALLAAFYYWGWDVSSNLGEETENSEENSGTGGMIGVAICFLLFELFTIVVNMNMPKGAIVNSSNILDDLGRTVGGGVGGKLMVLAVALSTIATLETTLIQVTRSLWSMSREATLPAAFGRLHSTWKTPVFATAVVATISVILFVVSSFANSVGEVMTDAIDAIGLQITIYYSLAGFAAVIAFRSEAVETVVSFPKRPFGATWATLVEFVMPLAGALFMLFIFVESLVSGSLDAAEIWIGVGAILIGLIPLLWYAVKGLSPYLKQRPTLGRVAPVEEFAAAEPLIP